MRLRGRPGSVTSRQRRLAATTLAVALCMLCPRPAAARDLASILRDAGRAIGGFLGGPFGGFAEAASTPTILSVETSGHRLIDDLDHDLGARLDQAGALSTQLLGQVDRSVAARWDQVDHSLEARILQVRTDLVDDAISKLDDLSRRRIDQISDDLGRNVASAIAEAEHSVKDVLAQADRILANRLADTGNMVHSSIAQIDQAAAARISQIDESVGTRIGNVDVIATKQAANVEAILIRIAINIGVVVLLAFFLWRIFIEVGAQMDKLQEAVPQLGARTRQGIRRALPVLGVQIGFGVLGLAAVFGLVRVLPRGADA